MAIAQLSIDLLVKLASFESDLKKASKAAESASSDIAKAFGIAKAGIAGLVGSLSVGALVEFFKATVSGVDKLNDLADATGASIENLSALEDVALRTGTSIDTVGDAVVKLNKSLGDAKGDSEQARALKALGLSADELKKADPAQALLDVSIALQKFADDGNKARIVQALFGKGLKEIAPLLNDLAQAGQLNAKVTTQQAKEAEKFNQELSKMSKNSLDAARSIVGPLVEAINKFNDARRDKENGSIAKALGIDGAGSAIDKAIAGYRLLGLARERITPLQILEKDPANPQALAELARIDAKAKELAGTFKTADEKLNSLLKRRPANEGGGKFVGSPLPDVKDDPEAKKAAESYVKLAEAIGQVSAAASEEIVNGEKLSAIEQLRNKVLNELNDGQTKYSATQRKSIEAALAGALVLDKDVKLRRTQQEVQALSVKLSEQQIALIERESDARLKANEDLREQVQEFGKSAEAIERLRIARLEDVAAQEDLNILAQQNIEGVENDTAARQLNLKALRDQIALRKQLLGKAEKADNSPTEGAQRAFDKYIESVEKAGVATEQAVSRSIGALEDDLTSSLAAGKFSVKNFVNTVLQEMIRLQVVRPLLASIFGGSSGGGGFASLFGGGSGAANSGFGTGSSFGNQDFGGFFASGGILGAGKWGIAGENGPEPIVGPAKVVPNSAMGGGLPIVINFNATGDITPSTVRYVKSQVQLALAQAGRR